MSKKVETTERNIIISLFIMFATGFAAGNNFHLIYERVELRECYQQLSEMLKQPPAKEQRALVEFLEGEQRTKNPPHL